MLGQNLTDTRLSGLSADVIYVDGADASILPLSNDPRDTLNIIARPKPGEYVLSLAGINLDEHAEFISSMTLNIDLADNGQSDFTFGINAGHNATSEFQTPVTIQIKSSAVGSYGLYQAAFWAAGDKVTTTFNRAPLNINLVAQSDDAVGLYSSANGTNRSSTLNAYQLNINVDNQGGDKKLTTTGISLKATADNAISTLQADTTTIKVKGRTNDVIGLHALSDRGGITKGDFKKTLDITAENGARSINVYGLLFYSEDSSSQSRLTVAGDTNIAVSNGTGANNVTFGLRQQAANSGRVDNRLNKLTIDLDGHTTDAAGIISRSSDSSLKPVKLQLPPRVRPNISTAYDKMF